MNFLAVNTAGESVEVALKTDGKEYVAFDSEYKKASEVLLPLIDKVFGEAGADIGQVDYFACCIGPGSFTGIRIGLSTVRAFCHSLNKPALAVTNTLVLSYNGTTRDEEKRGNIVTLSDAGNGYAYAAVYDGSHNVVSKPECIEASSVNGFLANVKEPYTICCDSLLSRLVPDSEVYKTGGNALIRAAEHIYNTVGTIDYKLLEPLYVRKAQAEMFLEEKNKA